MRGIVKDVLHALRRHRTYHSWGGGPQQQCLEDFFEKHLSEAKIAEIATRFAVPTQETHTKRLIKVVYDYRMMLYVCHVLSMRYLHYPVIPTGVTVKFLFLAFVSCLSRSSFEPLAVCECFQTAVSGSNLCHVCLIWLPVPVYLENLLQIRRSLSAN